MKTNNVCSAGFWGRFIQRYRNARTAVQQIRRGEWVPLYNSLCNECLTAHRGGLELWIGTGAWFCEIDGNYFGLFWRHYVWWAAARQMKHMFDRDNLRQAGVPIL